MGKETVEMLVDGGNAKAGPTTAPKFAMLGVNISEVFQKINEKTREYKGMNVPVKVIVDTGTKEYQIDVGVPPVSSLIKKELGLKKLAPEKKEEGKVEEKDEKGKEKTKEEKKKVEKKKVETVIMGNLTMDQCIKIAKMKRNALLAKDMRRAVKEIVASVVSMPLTIEGKKPKEVLAEIDDGRYDSKLASA